MFCRKSSTWYIERLLFCRFYLQEMLEKLPDGNYRRKLDIIPYKQCQLALDRNTVVEDPCSQVSLFAYINPR